MEAHRSFKWNIHPHGHNTAFSGRKVKVQGHMDTLNFWIYDALLQKEVCSEILTMGFNNVTVRFSQHSYTVKPLPGFSNSKSVSEMTYTVSSGTLNPSIPYHTNSKLWKGMWLLPQSELNNTMLIYRDNCMSWQLFCCPPRLQFHQCKADLDNNSSCKCPVTAQNVNISYSSTCKLHTYNHHLKNNPSSPADVCI